MEHLGISTPVVEFITLVLTSQRSIVESYLLRILSAWGFNTTFDVLLSLILQPVMGFERLSHYQENYGTLKQKYDGTIPLCGVQKLRKLLHRIGDSMLRWKLMTGLDCGWVAIGPGVLVRLMIIRRITRRKHCKTGKWKVKSSYYAIATNLDVTPLQLYRFYHARQRIEAGFRELKRHYAMERLPVSNFKGNEFSILCKMFAMTLVKLFQYEMLPTNLRTLQYKTLLRRILTRGLHMTHRFNVEICPKSKYKWVLQRMLGKLARMKEALSP